MKTQNLRKAKSKAHRWARQLERDQGRGEPELPLTYAIDQYLDHCRSNGLAHNTLRSYEYRLHGFLDFAEEREETDLTLWNEDSAPDLVAAHLDHRVESGEVTGNKEDRLALSAFFNYLRGNRWFKGQNPADAKLHLTRKPRSRLREKRCTIPEEDMVLRAEGQKHPRLWPVILLCRWAGLRRGEACTLRWLEINFTERYADAVGHEGGRKHPRRVWLADWVLAQLKWFKARQQPTSDAVWPQHPDTATGEWATFRREHPERPVQLPQILHGVAEMRMANGSVLACFRMN